MTNQNDSNRVDSGLLGAVRWRSIGPHRGGRVVAVAGDPVHSTVFYFGACAGGVWKTYDGGTYWENVSDGFLETSAVGAIAVADSDPNVIYVGMGEACIRGNISYGDGVYKSTDAGKTWVNVGLQDTRHISRIRIHPQNPDIVYVAALGHAFGPNSDRGVFRSIDGGATWEKVLYRSEKAGAADLIMDIQNPRVLFAAIWDAMRTPWSLIGSGPDSGIFRTTDGGDTWTEITDYPGLPTGLKGRIGVTTSPARAGRVWATVEAEARGVYRSDDNGDTWELVCDSHDIQGRPWYYQHIFADPKDPETVWVLNYSCWKSIDGGKTFNQVTTPHGDNHDLWIDPRNPLRMIEGNDGGANVSFNGGDTWSTIYNQPTAQFYHVRPDTQFPYRVYGTQQDNSAISVPSRTHKGAIPWGDCYPVGTSESGFIVVHPNDPNIVISGSIGSSAGGGGNMLLYNHRTGQQRIITVWPELYYGYGAEAHKYRFQWTYPIQFSPHDSDVLYVAGNLLFRSTNLGNSWEAISPDLTRGDPETLKASGGPVTLDTTNAETYGTIFAFAESSLQQGLFWAGSDDGLVHISQDGGKQWDDITPSEFQEWTLISMIEPSPHDPRSAYMACTRYKSDDTRPMLYKTNDYGKTWVGISNGIREGDYTRVIREDPSCRGLLYAGTETGVYVSFDDGDNWRELQTNLPVVPIYDLWIKDNDLLAATHGRSFWILDDLTQIHQLQRGLGGESSFLLKPGNVIRMPGPRSPVRPSSGKNYQLALGANVAYVDSKKANGDIERKLLDAGENPPNGVVVNYFLSEIPNDGVTLTFSESNGKIIKAFSSEPPQEGSTDPVVRTNIGMNRFVWNMRYPDAHKVPGDKTTDDSVIGPLAAPGVYQVTLTAGDIAQIHEFEIAKDPRVDASQEDLQSQFDLLIEVRDSLSETHDYINRLRNIRQQVAQWVDRAKNHSAAQAVADGAGPITERLTEIENELIQVNFTGPGDRLTLKTKLNRKLSEISAVAAAADYRPPEQLFDVFGDINARVGVQLQNIRDVETDELSQFMNLVQELDLPPIIPSSTP